MNRPPLPPAQIIEAVRKRLAEARSYDLRAEFDNLADNRRALNAAGSAQ